MRRNEFNYWVFGFGFLFIVAKTLLKGRENLAPPPGVFFDPNETDKNLLDVNIPINTYGIYQTLHVNKNHFPIRVGDRGSLIKEIQKLMILGGWDNIEPTGEFTEQLASRIPGGEIHYQENVNYPFSMSFNFKRLALGPPPFTNNVIEYNL